MTTASRDLELENAKRVAYVEHCFGGAGKPLSQPGRILVGEGTVMKLCRKKPKPRALFLFNDILLYGNIIISKKLYYKQKIMHLAEVRISPVDDDERLLLFNGFEIRSPSKSFIVCTLSREEKLEWMRHIQKCIDDTIAKQGTTIASAESPVWVPDDHASFCMRCKRSEFSVINRRHHCRKCGAVCCSSCSDKRWFLINVSPKPVRVCRSCYATLVYDSEISSSNQNGSQSTCTTVSDNEFESTDVSQQMDDRRSSQRSEFYDDVLGEVF